MGYVTGLMMIHGWSVITAFLDALNSSNVETHDNAIILTYGGAALIIVAVSIVKQGR